MIPEKKDRNINQVQKWSSNNRDRSMKVLRQNYTYREVYRFEPWLKSLCCDFGQVSEPLSSQVWVTVNVCSNWTKSWEVTCYQYGLAKHLREVSYTPYSYPNNLFPPLLKLSSQVNLPLLLFINSCFYFYITCYCNAKHLLKVNNLMIIT